MEVGGGEVELGLPTGFGTLVAVVGTGALNGGEVTECGCVSGRGTAYPIAIKIAKAITTPKPILADLRNQVSKSRKSN